MSVGIVSLLLIVVSLFFFCIISVRGFSMLPIVREGDKVLVQKTDKIERFDLVAFTIGENKKQIRRVIGLPGETIHYIEDTLYVNGQPVDEKFLVDAINESQKNGRNYTEDFTEKTQVIPEGYYFVLGDNRPYATDSRHYDLIAEKNILGNVIMKLF